MIERIQLGTKGAAKAMMVGQTKVRQPLEQVEKNRPDPALDKPGGGPYPGDEHPDRHSR